MLSLSSNIDVGSLISGSSAFPKSSLNIWKFTVHVLLKPGLENFKHNFTSMWDDCNCAAVWAFFGIAFLKVSLIINPYEMMENNFDSVKTKAGFKSMQSNALPLSYTLSKCARWNSKVLSLWRIRKILNLHEKSWNEWNYRASWRKWKEKIEILQLKNTKVKKFLKLTRWTQ